MSTFSQTGFQPTTQEDGFSVVGPDQSSQFPPKPKKRIVICCDGTWQSAAHGARSIPSNIAKISRSVANYYIDENGLMAPQIVYYDAGVGTAVGFLEKQMAGKSSIPALAESFQMLTIKKATLVKALTKMSAKPTTSSSTTTRPATNSSSSVSRAARIQYGLAQASYAAWVSANRVP